LKKGVRKNQITTPFPRKKEFQLGKGKGGIERGPRLWQDQKKKNTFSEKKVQRGGV